MSVIPQDDFGSVYEDWPTDRLRRMIAHDPSSCHPVALAAILRVLKARGIDDRSIAVHAGRLPELDAFDVAAARQVLGGWATNRLLRAATEDAAEYHPLALASIVAILKVRGIGDQEIHEFTGKSEPIVASDGGPLLVITSWASRLFRSGRRGNRSPHRLKSEVTVPPGAPASTPAEDAIVNTRRLVHRLMNELLDVPADRRAVWLEHEIPGDPVLRSRVLTSLPLEFDLDAASVSMPPPPERAVPDADVQRDADVSPRPSAADVLLNMRLGPWRVIEHLVHQGAMSTVYRGERADGAYQKQVAIKVIPHSPDIRTFLQRFARERHVLAQLEHPYVVRILDAGTTPDGRPYLVMEWVDGERIVDYIDRIKPNLSTRLELFLMVCQAVQHAHQGLIVHRDLKPANLLVATDGTPKVLDFGLATLLSPEASPVATLFRSKTGDGGFTLEYASPEQIRGERVTTATDVYALGMVLFELLTGRYPFAVSNKTPWEISEIVCREAPLQPSRATLDRAEPGDRAGISPGIAANLLRGDLDAIVLQALRKEPGGRYQTARELSDDISRFLKKKPVLARRRFGYRARRFLERHALAVSVLLAVTATLAIALILVMRSNSQASAALLATREALANSLILQSLGSDVSPARALDLAREAVEQAPQNHAARYRLAMLTGKAPPLSRFFHDVHFATIDPSGQRILVADGFRARVLTLALEDVASATHVYIADTMAYDAGSSTLAVASREGLLTVWQIADGKAAKLFERRRDAFLTDVAFRAGQLIVAEGQYVERWSLTGTLVDRRALAGEVVDLAPDGVHAVIDSGRQWTLVKVATGARVRVFDLNDLTGAYFSATGEHLSVLTANGMHRRYTSEGGNEITTLVGTIALNGSRPLSSGNGYVYFRANNGYDARGLVALPFVLGVTSHPDIPQVVGWARNVIHVWNAVAESTITAASDTAHHFDSRRKDFAVLAHDDSASVERFTEHLRVRDANQHELARLTFPKPQFPGYDEPRTLAIASRAQAVAAYPSSLTGLTLLWARQTDGGYIASEVPGRLVGLSDDGHTVAVAEPMLTLRDVNTGILLQRLELLRDIGPDPYLIKAVFRNDGKVLARYRFSSSREVFVAFQTAQPSPSVASSELIRRAIRLLEDRRFGRPYDEVPEYRADPDSRVPNHIFDRQR
jgi:tRNA A-37 threonylcarbamoyl transferase component Bud32